MHEINELPFFARLLLLLVVARLLGEIMERLKQPAMIGEILAGILLGPSLFDWIQMDDELKVFSQMAVFMLVIMAGLEIEIKEVMKGFTGKNLWIGLLGFFIPIGGGILIGLIFELDLMITVFLSLCISITALPVSVRILIDIGRLSSETGQKIISVAIFNDVVALMILGIVLDVKKDGGQDAAATTTNYTELLESISYTMFKVIGFIILIALAYRLIDRATKSIDFLREKTKDILKGKESYFATVFCFILLFASLSDLVGLHFVVGAFFGAMLLNKNILGTDKFEHLEKTTSSMTIGFLAPIFFAGIGLEFHFESLDNINLLLIVIAVSYASKILGGYLGSRISGLGHQQSLTIGIGLNARGVMELLIANIALTEGFISTSLFSILVIMGILTTISTPFMLKRAFDRMEAAEKI
jgi:Kef-type K+ transport system membrane component KefB